MPRTRRALLSSVAAGSVALAGCSLFSSDDADPVPDDPPPSGVDEPPDPDGHVHGADGEWSSFGANAGNTREVADGRAPVDRPTERWRVELSAPVRAEPVVAGDRVFLPEGDVLRVYDADDGSALWHVDGVHQTPLVRDGVAYVADGRTVRAHDAETGEGLWEAAFGVRGHVNTPGTYAGEELVCGAGEQVVGIHPPSGEVRWRRDVFGQVLAAPGFYSGGYGRVVATTAGEIVMLGDEGAGIRRWRLPSTPTCPPVVGTDSIYVNCRNGETYALMGDGGGQDQGVVWSTRTGWADPGIALVGDLVVVANGGEAIAVDGESGDRRWVRETGTWRWTAPAYGRDTLFVGGDRLRAFDPHPDGDPSNGPASRWERSFDGRVGPGPVLDDGTLYVVARVDAEERRDALVALS